MAIASFYPLKTTPVAGDSALGIDSADSSVKRFSLSALRAATVSGTSPDPGNGGTIATTGGVTTARITPVAPRTKCILAAGTTIGQTVTARNEGTYSVEFDADATSNVQRGVAVRIPGGMALDFEWSGTRWFPKALPFVGPGEFLLVDDFAGGLTAGATGTVGNEAWQTTFTGSGGFVNVGSLAASPGVAELFTGATSASLSAIYQLVLMAHQSEYLDVRWRAALQTNDANTTIRVGLASSGATAPPNDGAWWEKQDADTTWKYTTHGGGASTIGNSLVSVDTAFHIFRVRRRSATEFGFSLDGGAEVAIATTQPTTGLTPFAQVANSAAASKILYLDRMTLRIEGLTARDGI